MHKEGTASRKKKKQNTKWETKRSRKARYKKRGSADLQHKTANFAFHILGHILCITITVKSCVRRSFLLGLGDRGLQPLFCTAAIVRCLHHHTFRAKYYCPNQTMGSSMVQSNNKNRTNTKKNWNREKEKWKTFCIIRVIMFIRRMNYSCRLICMPRIHPAYNQPARRWRERPSRCAKLYWSCCYNTHITNRGSSVAPAAFTYDET